jgi:hypothetical protein
MTCTSAADGGVMAHGKETVRRSSARLCLVAQWVGGGWRPRAATTSSSCRPGVISARLRSGWSPAAELHRWAGWGEG